MYGFSRNDLLHVYLQKCYLPVIIYSQHFIGNCEEELPEKPISPLSIDRRLPTGYQEANCEEETVHSPLFFPEIVDVDC